MVSFQNEYNVCKKKTCFNTMFYSLVVKEGYKSFQAIKLRNIFYTLLLIVVMTKIIDGGGSFNYQREREYWPCSGEPRDDGGAVSCQYDKWV